MIRRLIEADMYGASDNPTPEKIDFWLTECRTPELLISLTTKYPALALRLTTKRPLLKAAIEGNKDEIRRLLRDEEDREKELDQKYWAPLKAELETWRRNGM